MNHSNNAAKQIASDASHGSASLGMVETYGDQNRRFQRTVDSNHFLFHSPNSFFSTSTDPGSFGYSSESKACLDASSGTGGTIPRSRKETIVMNILDDREVRELIDKTRW